MYLHKISADDIVAYLNIPKHTSFPIYLSNVGVFSNFGICKILSTLIPDPFPL